MLNLDLWKLLLDLKSIASDILRYIFEPAEWIRYIAIYFNLPSEYNTWPADKPPIYLQKSFISSEFPPIHLKVCIQPTLFPSLMDPKVELSAACHVDMWIWKRVDMLGSVCGAAGNCRIINCCPVAPDQTMMTRAR